MEKKLWEGILLGIAVQEEQEDELAEEGDIDIIILNHFKRG